MTDIVWNGVGMQDVPDDDEWVDDADRRRLEHMRFAKRRSESRLGRWAARTTAATFLGLSHGRDDLARVAVRNAADGAPELFVDGEAIDVSIAMTDRADWAVTAIRHGHHRIGCDLELVEPRSRAFVTDYFTVEEQATVAAGDPDVLANLIWSAKESALKVLRTGLRRDTRSVSVSLGGREKDGWGDFTVAVSDGAPQWGWWIRHGDFLLTVASATPSEPPRAIVDPSPLATARPGHRWMSELPVDGATSQHLAGGGA